MNHLRLLLLLLLTLPVFSQVLNPSAYATPHGELGPSGLLFRDDLYKGNGNSKDDLAPLSGGLGQLSDGSTGCDSNPGKDCGSGPGYDWVGWHKSDPTVTFTFPERCDFKMVRIFTANRPDQGAPLWKSVTVSISDDGLNFRDTIIRTATPEEQQDHNARYLEIPVTGTGKFVQIQMIRAAADSWILVSEVAFMGRIAHDQAPRSRPK